MTTKYKDKTGRYELIKNNQNLYIIKYKKYLFSYKYEKLYLAKNEDNRWDLRFLNSIISKSSKESSDIKVDYWDKETMPVAILNLIEKYKKK